MKISRTFRKIAVTTVVAIVGALAVQQAFASGEDTNAQSTVSANKGGKRIVAVREDASSSTSSSTFVTLATASVTIPANQTGLMVAHFSAEALCSGSGGWCPVRILIDGTEMIPQSGTDFAFASAGNNFNSSAMERTWQGAAAGNHTFTLQYCVTAGATTSRLDDWVFDVEFWRQS